MHFCPPVFVQPVQDRISYRLHSHDLQISLPTAQSFLSDSIRIWNSLPVELVHTRFKLFDAYCKSDSFYNHVVSNGFVTVL